MNIEVQLTDELSGNLRNMKVRNGNILIEERRPTSSYQPGRQKNNYFLKCFCSQRETSLKIVLKICNDEISLNQEDLSCKCVVMLLLRFIFYFFM
jgi:hypothetical protein